jgi:hypothetical protein
MRGFKGGTVFGETDAFDTAVAGSPVNIHEILATILHQLGLEHERLTLQHSGRYMRLTAVYGNVLPSLPDKCPPRPSGLLFPPDRAKSARSFSISATALKYGSDDGAGAGGLRHQRRNESSASTARTDTKKSKIHPAKAFPPSRKPKKAEGTSNKKPISLINTSMAAA